MTMSQIDMDKLQAAAADAVGDPDTFAPPVRDADVLLPACIQAAATILARPGSDVSNEVEEDVATMAVGLVREVRRALRRTERDYATSLMLQQHQEAAGDGFDL